VEITEHLEPTLPIKSPSSLRAKDEDVTDNYTAALWMTGTAGEGRINNLARVEPWEKKLS